MPLLMKEIQDHMVKLVPATPQLNMCDEGIMVINEYIVELYIASEQKVHVNFLITINLLP